MDDQSMSGTASATAGSDLPLAGLRVIEMSHMVMGPACGVILADLGADVIKVEPAGKGDNTRRLTGSGAGYFATYGRNKRSIALDTRSEQGRRALLDLLDGADAFIENFRPGAMDEMGLGYDALSLRNPRLIYVSLKGFLDGPYGKRTALDEVVQMMSGLAWMTGPPGRPLRAGASVNDVMGGMFGVIGLLAALQRRQITGQGEHVVSGLFETSAYLVAQHMAQARLSGRDLQPMSVRQPAWGLYDIFETRDGKQVFVAAVTDGQWRQFCEAFGRPDLGSDPELATNPLRVGQRDRLIPELARLFATVDRADLIARLERIGLPFADVNSPAALFDDPHLAASGGLIDVSMGGETLPIPGLPVSLGGQRLGHGSQTAAIGEHGVDILAEIGWSVTDIEALRTAGALTVSDRKR